MNGRQKIDKLQRNLRDVQQGMNEIYSREKELDLKKLQEENRLKRKSIDNKDQEGKTL